MTRLLPPSFDQPCALAAAESQAMGPGRPRHRRPTQGATLRRARAHHRSRAVQPGAPAEGVRHGGAAAMRAVALVLAAALPLRALALMLAAVLPLRALGHSRESVAVTQSPFAWNFELWVLVLLAVSAAAYAIGIRRLWVRAGRGRGVSQRQALWFGLGWTVLAVSLVSPLDTLGNHLFWAHMVQHELLMIVAAPLLVMGRPLSAWVWCLSARQRQRLPGILSRPVLAGPWTALTHPLSAWSLHALAIWVWHIPVLFDASLHSEWVHAAQHASFLFTALLFWWAVLGTDARSGRCGPALASLFSTMVHTAVLGALLTVAPTPWYPGYEPTSRALGWNPLEDQQLGGLIMWVPAGAAYLIAGLLVGARLLAGQAAPPSRRHRPNQTS
jgi:putative membrane protein